MNGRLLAIVIAAVTGVVAAAGTVLGQSTDRSGIQGRVVDQTHAVLPAVTVAVSSAALIEGRRTTQTDGEGRYRFTALPSGVYALTFEFAGFVTLRRADIQLGAGFVATIDGELSPQSVEETITVPAASPVIDARTAAVSTNLNKAALEQLPTSRSMWQVFAMVPGLRVTGTPDIGGSAVGTQQEYQTYGTSNGGNRPTIDGVDTREGIGGAGFYYDYGAFQEVQVKAMGNDAEMPVPGTNFVGVLKSGGDTFRGSGLFAWETPRLQSDNLDDALRAQGTRQGNPLKAYHDANVDLGGPVLRRRLWFYASYRNQEIRQGLLGYVSSLGADNVLGTADDEPGEYRVLLKNYTGKVTGQASTRHRFASFVQYQVKDQPERSADAFRTRASTWNQLFRPLVGKAEWTWAKSDRTLVNAFVGRWKYRSSTLTNSDDPPRYDTVTLRYDGSSESGPATSGTARWQYSASMTHYLPRLLGNHELKAGVEILRESGDHGRFARPGGNDFTLRLQNGRPFEVVLNNAPFTGNNRMDTQTAFVRDVWAVSDQLTLNVGLRFDRYFVFLPAQEKPAGRFSEAGSFPALDVRDWRRWAPRAGAAWALDETRRTVVKMTYGWFNYVTEPTISDPFNRNSLSTTTYRWNDLDGDLNYDDGELGPFVTSTGASNSVLNTSLRQPKTHELTATLERQLGPGFSARTSYVYKRESGRFQAVNIARPFDAFNIPLTGVDPGPDGVTGTADDGGPLTYYDFAPEYQGPAFLRNMDQNTPGFNNVYHNIEVAAQKRFARRWQLVTSFLLTRPDVWRSGVPQDPNAAGFYPKSTYWDRVFKLSGSYELPLRIHAAGMFTSQSGAVWARDARFTDGLRQLTQLVLQMEPMGARRLPTQNLLNLRLEKRQKLRAGDVALQLDLFNATNSNAALGVTARSGPSFGRITTIVAPRVVRLGVSCQF